MLLVFLTVRTTKVKVAFWAGLTGREDHLDDAS